MDGDSYWVRLKRGTVTRRRFVVGAAAGGMGLAAAGCGRSGGRPASTGAAAGSAGAAAQPRPGGYLHHLAAHSAANIDPATTEDSTAYGFVETDWYDPLTRIEYTPAVDWRIANKVTPWLADRFEQVDKTTYTFNVRSGVKFHNGDALSAQDVAFTYNRIKDPATKANPNVRMYLDSVDKVEAPDDSTVRITTKRPSPDFLAGISGRNTPIVPKKYVESGGDLTKVAVGTGPFKLMSYQKDGTAMATRFTGSWLAKGPYLDGIKIVLKTDDSTASAAFSAGEADFVSLHDRKEADPVLKAAPKTLSKSFPVEEVHGVVFNQTKPPFSDARVRLALHLVIDRQAADKAVNFGDGLIGGPIVIVGKTGWGVQPDELAKLPGYRQPKAQDVAEAKRLLTEAGFANGFKTTLGFSSTNGSAPAYAQVIQAQIKQIGIDATVLPLDNATFTQRRVKPDYDLMIVSEGSLSVPGNAAYSSFYSSGVYSKPAGINDPDLDTLIDAQAAEFDYSKRGAIFAQIERQILEKAYKAPISTPKAIRLSQPWVHNWVDNRSAHQTIMNPEAIWMSLEEAPANRRQA
ncbi:MAG TPA: ABC transporter substrate-binding protein [Dehalococcoidia bacterium]|nr:ABC transporter substrate-binding protein [Dehalococcoidia bacterium]